MRNLTDQVFGEWTVLDLNPNRKPGAPSWMCRCSCGSVVAVKADSLKDGKSTRCRACANVIRVARVRANPPHKTHGASQTRQYYVWKSMRQRCRCPKDPQWKDYGGRGITVCQRWNESYEAFLADMGPSNGLTLERDDNNGNYEPGNCRWATRREQRANTRHVHLITFNGVTQPIAAWARQLGCTHAAMTYRLRRWGILAR